MLNTLTPPCYMCKYIPSGDFQNSHFVYQLDGTLAERASAQSVMCPAPTLDEFLLEPNTELEVFRYRKTVGRILHDFVCWSCPADAMLRTWLRWRGIDYE